MSAEQEGKTTMNNTKVTVRVDAKDYEDCDDCLAAAAEDYASEHGLEGYDLSPRWADEEREEIVLTVPRWAVLAQKLQGLANDARYWDLRRTFGDNSREVLAHLESCARAQRVEL